MLMTPLNYALLRNHKDIIAFLIHKGAERQFLDFSHVPYREEMMQFVHEGYLDDEYNEEKMISKFCKGRIDDVLEFQYPECPEIDPEKRYANKEYIKEIKERNKRYVKKKEQKNEKNDDDDDNNHDDINAE
ncbi:hypothetical protein M9Y10_041041 [Tritrichomonas musculus]|uniref:Ankyrin repeat protein n=1 Tax=Tritrichomonas musculus TaxID=1915356 RepID=A0ABR2K4C8_9EUKA